MIENLIANISNTTIQNFFKHKIAAYKPTVEDLNYIIEGEERFEQFSQL